jgi:hypothetical protein
MSKPPASAGKSKGGSSYTRAIKVLRQLIDTKVEPQHVEAYFREISGAKNDRGMGILMVTGVEDALENAIEARLTGQRGALFGYDAPIGTFANKISIGFALEIFGPTTKQNLELLKAIRNAFAHSKISIDFETPAVENACDLLELTRLQTLSDGTQPRWSVQIQGYKGRARFQYVCHGLAHNFAIYAQLGNQRPPPGVQDNRYETIIRPKRLH